MKNNSVLATNAEQMTVIFIEISTESKQVVPVQVIAIPYVGSRNKLTGNSQEKLWIKLSLLCKIAVSYNESPLTPNLKQKLSWRDFLVLQSSQAVDYEGLFLA